MASSAAPYVAAAALSFVLCLGAQLVLYLRVLVPGLAGRGRLRPGPRGQPAPLAAVKRWAALTGVVEAVVVLAVVAYAFLRSRLGGAGLAWVAPPLAALIGTALPLQLAAFRILRSLGG